MQIPLVQVQARLYAGCLGPSLEHLKFRESKTDLIFPPHTYSCFFFFPYSVNNTPSTNCSRQRARNHWDSSSASPPTSYSVPGPLSPPSTTYLLGRDSLGY